MYTYLKSQWFEYRQQRHIERRFYTNPTFARLDQQLLERYKGQSPYALSVRFLQSRGCLSVHTYGETPLTTMANIVSAFDIRSQDRVIDMGGGRGRVGLFLAAYCRCYVTTYEQVPAFVEKGITCDNHQMVLGDMFEADFRKTDVIYLYGTMLEEDEIQLLAKKFPLKVKIITVSYPLAAYDPNYQTKKTLKGQFPWGKTEIYLNERISQ